MTERPTELHNFFYRQGLLSGNRAPVLMGNGVKLEAFHETAGASVVMEGKGKGWTPVTTTEEQVKGVPWAAQYLNCARDATADCKGHEYTAGCWVEREVRACPCRLVLCHKSVFLPTCVSFVVRKNARR